MFLINKSYLLSIGSLIFCTLLLSSVANATPYNIIDLGEGASGGLHINDQGQVYFVIGNQPSFIYSPTDGISHNTEFIGRNFSDGGGINNLGQITGISNSHASIYTPSNAITENIDTLGSSWSRGISINDAGQVTGKREFIFTETSITDSGILNIDNISLNHAFFYTPETGMKDIGTLDQHNPYGESYGNSINSFGSVTGTSSNYGASHHAFIYTFTTGIKDIGTLGLDSEGLDINDSGYVVGSFVTPKWIHNSHFYNSNAFLYTPDLGMQNLNDLVGSSLGTSLTSANSINNSGQILAMGANYHSYILSPAPEPEIYMSLLFALGSLAAVRRKKLKTSKIKVNKRVRSPTAQNDVHVKNNG
ncbi:MAG: hypothetical protein V4525_03745 [Pseudomonadota bacterium]